MTTNEFVTAEDIINPKSGIWVLLETWSVNLGEGFGIVPSRFAVTTSTRYRAELPACTSDMHAPGFLNCTRALKGASLVPGRDTCKGVNFREHCHGYHLPRAEAFRDRVAATFTKKINSAPRGLIEVRPSLVSPWSAKSCYDKTQRGGTYDPATCAELLGMTVEEYRAELMKARS